MKRSRDCGMSLVCAGFLLASALVMGTARADFTFGEPAVFGAAIPAFDATCDMLEFMSYDGLELYFSSTRPGGQGYYDLWVSKRTATDQDWGPMENLGPVVNTLEEDSAPSISRDGLNLYFSSNRDGDYDLYVTTRAGKDAPWGLPVNLGGNVNSSSAEHANWISPNGLELYFFSLRPGGYGRGDIYVATRETTEDPWGQAANLGSVVNSAYEERFLSLSPDGLLLLFGETKTAPWRPGGYGGSDVWISRRASLSDPWQSPVNAGPNINGPERENGPRISPDGLMFHFDSQRTGRWENYQAPILPLVDFNGDELVDLTDLLMLIDAWGTDESLYDIGPFAWGDGVVDATDLRVFMEYWEAANLPQDGQ